MIPTTDEGELWLKHILGELRLTNRAGIRRFDEAVELNKDGGDVVSTFGNQEFHAMVGFIDMRGFSTMARGKSPMQVRDLVLPFIEAIINSTSEQHGLIDKSIGDEVMVILPMFTEDAVCSDVRLPPGDLPIIAVSVLLHELIKHLAALPIPLRFSAGFAYGTVVLSRVGNGAYSEWTIYGNTVNAAKRLESWDGHGQWQEGHSLAIGAISEEHPSMHEALATWSEILVPAGGGPLLLHEPQLRTEDLKGVGDVVFIGAGVRSRPECL